MRPLTWLLVVALYDGDAPRLLEDLREASVDHLLVRPGHEPPASLKQALESAGVAILRAGPETVVIENGLWPGLRANIVSDQQRDIGFAAATAEPWVNENGWMLLHARGVAPEKRAIFTYNRPKDLAPKIGANALAIAEAAVFGGSYAVPAGALAESTTPRGRADRRRTIAQLKFLADHPDWFSGDIAATVDVLADTLAPIREVMNLLVRRNLPFRAFAREHWPTDRPAALVLVGQPPLSASEQAKVMAWRSAGTAILERASVADPSAFAAAVRSALGDRRPFRLTNAQEVIAVLSVGKQRVLHLLNYGIDPIQGVGVQLAQQPSRATLFAPETPAGAALEIRHGEILIPEMGISSAILLED
jgi:hypothetical protein